MKGHRVIEVEIKVHVTDEQKQKLLDGAQKSSEETLVDEYYDSPDFKLTTKGYWLRRRNGHFELKRPATQSEKFDINQNIPMQEIVDEDEIAQALDLTVAGSFIESLAAAGYQLLYKFTNLRQRFVKNEFTIDFDHADFGDLQYQMCEVEMMVNDQSETQAALDKLYAFVSAYGIPTTKAEGKMSYYIKRKNPEHHHAILRAQAKR